MSYQFVEEFAGIKGELMKRRGWIMVILAAVMVAVTIPNASFAQQKKLVLWTHWEQNPDFNKWYEAKGKSSPRSPGTR